jgi:hypothetical protein
MDAVDYLERLGAKFVKCSGGKQVWELPYSYMIPKVLHELRAKPFNWCSTQQPEGPPRGIRAQVIID